MSIPMAAPGASENVPDDVPDDDVPADDVPDLVADILAQCARTPDAVALQQGGRRLTYRALGERVLATSARLQDAGMVEGDRVLFSVRPRTEGLVLALGIVAAGGSLVLVDPGSAPELFAARVRLAAPRWAATESVLHAISRWPLSAVARRRGLLLPRFADLPVRHLHAGPRLPGVPRTSLRPTPHPLPRSDFLSFTVVGERQRSRSRHRIVGGGVGRRPGAEALVVFTSGTTAAPRAVVHTRGSLGAGTRLLDQVAPSGPGGRVHTDQMLLGMPALVSGATWSLPDRPPGDDPAAFAQGLVGASSSFLVPADVTSLLDHLESRADGVGTGPATMLVGGAPVTARLLERATRVWPRTRWMGVYGMTEVLPVAAVEADEKLAAAVAAAGDLVGRPLEGIRARVDAPDERGVGELVLSGPSLMRGYLGQAVEPEHRTGDLARWDDEGRLVLVGRVKDMLIRRLTNIYPALYEPALTRLPGVAEALLVGVPRPEDADEVVVLVVVSDDGAPHPTGARYQGLRYDERLDRRLRPHLLDALDHAALPDHVLRADAIPTAGRSRKPDRARLAAEAARVLGIDA